MAPIDDTALHNSEALIARKPRNFYLTSIKPIHWQLRSIIGVSESGTVYYPAGPTNQHLQELDPTTKKSETVAYLEFSPRCLVATKGWVCCGGELGEFVAIRASKQADHSPGGDERSSPEDQHRHGLNRQPEHHDGGNDNRQQAYDDDEYDNFDTHMCDAPLVTVPPRMTARSGKFGEERVNCVTVWTPSSIVPLYPGAYTFPVAALSNNDKTVTLVNLETAEPLDSMDFPDCVNRAVLSPDGQILASVSDDPYLYIHERVRKQGAPVWSNRSGSSQSETWDSDDYEWKLLAKHHLRGQSKDDTSVHRGSFAACFSNTGRYLAIGTQYGVISVYDATRLADPDTCTIACFSSSSPNNDNGAVREMTFCPGPYDLLAWSEDHGAAGVADIRDCFVSRQILSLTEDESYTHFRVRQTIRMNGELEERRQRRQALGENDSDQALRIRDALDRYHSPIASDESQLRQLLDPGQDRQRRRELRDISRDLDRERIQTYLGRRSAILRSRPSRIPAATSTAGAAGAAGASGTNAATPGSSSNNNNNNGDSSGEGQPIERIDVDAAVNDILGTFRSLRNRDVSETELRFLGSGSAGLLQAARRTAGAAIPTIENEEYASETGDIDDYSSLFGARTEMTRRRIHRMQQQQQQPIFPWDPTPLPAGSSSRDEMGAFGSSSRGSDLPHAYTTDSPVRRTNGFIRAAQRRARERQLMLENAAIENASTPEAQLLQSGLLSWDSSGSGYIYSGLCL
ncbi:wd domain containing protein [Ophiostoma piceae UAMH 11346]|uniref:Wd domain containing protein n=1 Tax=Ophiostoma piceae (strain UAMH 11346) TaxID=1262450 RepID=S3C2V8_OPHP1|nr:wd domain containing protein [Ophiostoma piceae UAMH 11346]